MTETTKRVEDIDNSMTGLAVPFNKPIPYNNLTAKEQALMDYGSDVKDIMDDELSKSDRLMSVHEAVQIYDREQKTRKENLESRVAAIFEAGQNQGKHYWYFPKEVQEILNNKHRGFDYTFNEVRTACANLHIKRILFGKDFKEGKGFKYVWNTH